jgi:hypothetical protein
MNEETQRLLEKTLPKLIVQPKIMEGFDISPKQIIEIEKTKQIPYRWLNEIAWDRFFESCHNNLELTFREALLVRDYLIREAFHEIDNFKKMFPFII